MKLHIIALAVFVISVMKLMFSPINENTIIFWCLALASLCIGSILYGLSSDKAHGRTDTRDALLILLAKELYKNGLKAVIFVLFMGYTLWQVYTR